MDTVGFVCVTLRFIYGRVSYNLTMFSHYVVDYPEQMFHR